MTFKQLATKAGCTDAYLSQLERARANPSVMTLRKIAATLKMQVADFLREGKGMEEAIGKS
jgi:transcriptional regulator with XRE-family HTH domain